MNSKTGGRVVIATALILSTGIVIGALSMNLLGKARAGAEMLKNRNTEVTIQRDIVYRTVDGRRLRLDVYHPAGDVKKARPALLMLHGGSWRSGSKEQLNDVAKPFAQQGYVIANINYRLAPESKFPAQIEDAKAAVRWMRRNAAKYGIDPNRIGVVGFSAGAHLAALVGTSGDADFLDHDTNDVSSRVRAVISVSGPFDFIADNDADADNRGLDYLFGGTYREKPALYRAGSPLLAVSKDTAPMLLIDGLDDPLVNPREDDKMAAALKKAGVDAEVIHVKNAAHVLMPSNGKPIDPPLPMILLQAGDFLHRHLK